MRLVPVDIDHSAAPNVLRNDLPFLVRDVVRPEAHPDFQHFLTMLRGARFNRRRFAGRLLGWHQVLSLEKNCVTLSDWDVAFFLRGPNDKGNLAAARSLRFVNPPDPPLGLTPCSAFSLCP